MRVLSFNDRFDLNLRQAFSLFLNDVYIHVASKLIVKNFTKSKFNKSVSSEILRVLVCTQQTCIIAPCIMTLTFISTCVYKPLCLNNSCSYQK